MSAEVPAREVEFHFSGGIAEFIKHLNHGQSGAAR